jgi:hypothetical protein
MFSIYYTEKKMTISDLDLFYVNTSKQKIYLIFQPSPGGGTPFPENKTNDRRRGAEPPFQKTKPNDRL